MEELEKAFGFSHCEHSLFLDDSLNIGMADIFHYDWAHCYFINGVFNREMDAFMRLMAPHNAGVEYMNAYFAGWRWPKGYASGSMACAKGSVNGSMSEMLSASNVIRKFVFDVVLPKNIYTKACESLICLIHVLDLLLHAQRGCVDATDLESRIILHHRKQQAAYGTTLSIPKAILIYT